VRPEPQPVNAAADVIFRSSIYGRSVRVRHRTIR
jgi:hypothetical protein